MRKEASCPLAISLVPIEIEGILRFALSVAPVVGWGSSAAANGKRSSCFSIW
jgi:hypothetical protein